LHLTKLQQSEEYLSPESIDAAVTACPHVQSVSRPPCWLFQQPFLLPSVRPYSLLIVESSQINDHLIYLWENSEF
jgi:hypothetical protein